MISSNIPDVLPKSMMAWSLSFLNLQLGTLFENDTLIFWQGDDLEQIKGGAINFPIVGSKTKKQNPAERKITNSVLQGRRQ